MKISLQTNTIKTNDIVKNIISVLLFLVLFGACSEIELKLFHAQMQDYKYGRCIEIQPESTVNLIASASGVEIIFTGDTCSLKKNIKEWQIP